jgi:hypothetical protein
VFTPLTPRLLKGDFRPILHFIYRWNKYQWIKKHCTWTNIAIGQTSVSDTHCSRTNFCVGQTLQLVKLLSRTHIVVGQTFVSDKHCSRTNIVVGQTFVSDKHCILCRTNNTIGQTLMLDKNRLKKCMLDTRCTDKRSITPSSTICSIPHPTFLAAN